MLALGVQESCLKVRMLKMPNNPEEMRNGNLTYILINNYRFKCISGYNTF